MFWLKHPQDRREITVTQAFTHKVTCHVDLKTPRNATFRNRAIWAPSREEGSGIKC